MAVALVGPRDQADVAGVLASADDLLAAWLDPGVADPQPRFERFAALRSAVRTVAQDDAWRANALTTELLLLVEALRDELAADEAGTDPEWRVREVLQRLRVVLSAMTRRLEHDALDRPEEAARYVVSALADVEVGAVAELLGTSPRMVGNYRRGEVGRVRKDPDRVTLVAQLVAELLGSMTARGVLLWFDAPVVGGRTPREVLDSDPAAARIVLLPVARGGRAQLDRVGWAPRGRLDDAA